MKIAYYALLVQMTIRLAVRLYVCPTELEVTQKRVDSCMSVCVSSDYEHSYAISFGTCSGMCAQQSINLPRKCPFYIPRNNLSILSLWSAMLFNLAKVFFIKISLRWKTNCSQFSRLFVECAFWRITQEIPYSRSNYLFEMYLFHMKRILAQRCLKQSRHVSIILRQTFIWPSMKSRRNKNFVVRLILSDCEILILLHFVSYWNYKQR